MIDITDEKFLSIDYFSDEKLQLMKEQVQTSKYLVSYHIYPKHGLLNDPNGLHQKDGVHHIFYQWHPNKPIHGLKYWYHLTTKDFITYQDRQIAIKPENNNDSYGVYSGSAHKIGSQVLILYTGNDVDEYNERVATQMIGTFENNEVTNIRPIIKNKYFTEHFRDPKVFKYNKTNYIVIGAQDKDDLLGCLAMYKTDDFENYSYIDKLKLKMKSKAYMYECPDMFIVQNKLVTFFSPQGEITDKKDEMQNKDNVIYLISDGLDEEDLSLINEKEYKEFDKGFDFYAPQSYIDESKRRILIGWAGSGQAKYKTKNDEWAEVLTMPRELIIDDDYIKQFPLEEYKKLELEELEIKEVIDKNINTLKITFRADDEFKLYIESSKKQKFEFSRDNEYYKISRFNQEIDYKEGINDKINRYAPIISNTDFITIYIDNSIVEIFLNENRYTMTSRIFLDDYKDFVITNVNDLVIKQMASINLEYIDYDNKRDSKT